MSGYWLKWASVPCPFCSAKVGERCRTASGQVAVITHAARWDAMKAREQSERTGA
jgi:hypothetical protein